MYRKFFKRFFDIVLSGFALIILSPVFLILAILVRTKLGSPVLFKQKRPGKDCKIFTMHKFRTMTNATDEEGNLLPDSERLTKFGRFLRSTSLDELPEIWDIFRGKMSIIGPRPLLISYVEYYSEAEKTRHDVRPGLTGLAQVEGRNAMTWEEKFDLDLFYISEISAINDIRIFFKTIKKVLKREGILVGEQHIAGRLDVEREVFKRSTIAESGEIKLIHFSEADIPKKVEWINNPLNNKYLHYELPLNIEKTQLWFEKIKNDYSRLDCTIMFGENKVGLIGLINIDRRKKNAEYYVTVGELEYKGRGIAKKASHLILEVAFSQLCLDNIYLYTEVDNIDGQKLFETLGFKRESEEYILEYDKRMVSRFLYTLTKEKHYASI